MLSPDEQTWLTEQLEQAIEKQKPCTIEVHSGTVFTVLFRDGKVSVSKAPVSAVSSASVIQPEILPF